jgi:glucose-1-phosphate cytidylyltransferase
MPKPMVPVGDRPILWHIMKHFAHYGFNDFVLCLGHMGWQIKEFFLNYQSMTSDFTISLGSQSVLEYHNGHPETGWKVTMAETGEATLTAGRIKRALKYIEEPVFFATYGDGVGNVNLAALLEFHLSHGRAATLTGVKPTGRFGELSVDGNRVVSFQEKPDRDGSYINGGFFVFNRSFFDQYVPEIPLCDGFMLERQPLQQAAESGDLMIFPHHGFRHAMDTYRDWEHLSDLWRENRATWKTW